MGGDRGLCDDHITGYSLLPGATFLKLIFNLGYAVDNKVLIFLPLSAVSNDEGELPHIQKSDEKESRSTTFIHCDACASSETGEGELVSNGLVGPPVCGVGLRRGARPTLPNTG